jgi:hypothetical protein
MNLNLRIAIMATVTGLTAPMVATAGTINFTDQLFTVVQPSIQAGALANQQPRSFTKEVDGVTFSFTALTNVAGDLRFTGIAAGSASDVVGIRVGGAGGSLLQFSFSSSEAITIQGYTIGGGPNNAAALPMSLGIFEGLGIGGTQLSTGNSLVTGGSLGLSIGATQSVTFAIEGGGSTSIASLGSLSFEKTVIGPPQVPLPATVLFLLGALASLAVLRGKGQTVNA